MSHGDCPSHQELSAYLMGELDDGQFVDLTKHVDNCTPCQETVIGLGDAEDTMVSRLRRPVSEDAFESESECRNVLALVEAIGQEPSQIDSSGRIVENTGQSDLGNVREYLLLAELGKGGMGTVYKALHTKLGKVVALKVLSADRVKNPEAVARFEREMRAIGTLEHPNIVRATDAGEADGVHYLVMEYVRGTDLSSLVRSRGALNVADACELIRQAAVGLQYAHEHGMVHRDIKPSNLMLTVTDQQTGGPDSRSATVKILDMGLALLAAQPTGGGHELTTTGQIMGTLDYMAPEQGGDSHQVDIRADIYSLGATLYKLLCGEAPFGGKQLDGPVKKLMALANQSPTPLCDRRAELPAELSALVDRMLAKNPDDRHATPLEVAQALAPFTAGHDLASLLGESPQEAGRQQDVADESLNGTKLLSSTALVEPPSHQQARVVTAEKPKSIPAEATVVAVRPVWFRPTVVALGLFIVGVAGVMLIRVATDKGELVIESDAADVEVIVKRSGKTVRLIELEQGENRTTIRSGDYEIAFVGARAEKLRIENGTFTMERDGHVIAKVTRVVLDPVAPDTVASAAPDSWQPGPAENVLPGLIARPAKRPGVDRWQLETRLPRSEIGALAFSPDGRLLALGTNHGLVRVYDAQTRKLVKLLVDHTKPVNAIAWKQDGSQLASADYEGTICVWNVDGSLVRAIQTNGDNAYALVWHPDGKRLMWAGEGGIKICALDEIPQRFSGDYHEIVHSIAWSPDGQQLASGGNDTMVHLWNADGTLRKVFEGHEGLIDCVAWSPDGQQLATASGPDRTVRFWTKDGLPGSVITGWTGFRNVAWRPDGEKVVATCQHELWLLSKDGKKEHVVRTEQNVNGLAWQPNGNRLFAGGRSGQVDTINLDGEAVTFLEGHPTGWGFVAWSPDGEKLAATQDSRLWQWDHNGEFKRQFGVGDYGVVGLDWHPNGAQIAIDCLVGGSQIWNPDAGNEPLLKIEGDFPRWSPDGQSLAVITGRGIELRNQDGTEGKTFETAPGSKIKFLAWSPDSKWLAGGGDDGKVLLWSGDGRLERVFDEQPHAIHWLAWSHDSTRLASARRNNSVYIHDLDGTTGPVLNNRTHAVESVAWNPDDQRLAATIRNAVCLWEANGTQGPVLQGHLAIVRSVDFNVKTGILASMGDNTIRLWDGATGEPQKTIVLMDGGRSATFSSAGQMLDGDAATFEDDFVYFVEQPDGRIELRSRLDAAGSESTEAPEPGRPETSVVDMEITWQPGPAENVLPGLIARPAVRPGVGRWQLETRLPRSEIRSIAFSPDGRLLALGTQIGLVRIYDTQTRELVRLLVGHTDCVTSVAWKHDGRQLVSADFHGTVRVWKVDGTLVRVFSNKAGHAYSVAWHPDGNRLAWGAFGGIWISEINGIPRQFSREYTRPVLTIAWSPDGQQLASGGSHDDPAVRIWDADGNPVRVFEGHTGSVNCVAWSPNGQQLASVSLDRTARLWNSDGTVGPVLKSWGYIMTVAWSPDGKKVMTACQHELQLWGTDGTREHVTNSGQSLTCLAWLPNDKWPVAGGNSGRVVTLDINGDPETIIGGHPTNHGFLTWSPDGETLAATHDGQLWQWNRNGGFERRFEIGASHPDWHPDGDRIAASYLGPNTSVWNSAGEGQRLFTVEGGCPRWNPDGRSLAVITARGIELRNQDGTEGPIIETPPDSKIRVIAWSPDGKWLAAGGEDGEVLVWSREGKLQQLAADAHKCGIEWLAWSHDGKCVASASCDNTVRMQSVDGTEGPVLKGHSNNVLSVAWSPDDKRLVSTSTHEMWLWAADGTRQRALEGHLQTVRSVDFNNKTGTLASMGGNTIRLWDGMTGDPQKTILLMDGGRSATFSAAGQMLDGDAEAFETDFVYFVEQPDGRMKLFSDGRHPTFRSRESTH